MRTMNFISSIILSVISIFMLSLFTGCEPENSIIVDPVPQPEPPKPKQEINPPINLNFFNADKMLSRILSGKEDGKFVVAHISDVHVSHWSSNNSVHKPKNLIEAVDYVNKSNKFDVLVATGDFIHNHQGTPHETAMGYLNVFSKNLFTDTNRVVSLTCTGNHDGNMINKDKKSWITTEDFYNTVTSKIGGNIKIQGRVNYYYYDLPDNNGGYIRFISLDEMDNESDSVSTQLHPAYSHKQIDWFVNVALKEGMTPRHSVVILTHHPLPTTDKEVLRYVYNEHEYSWYMIPEIVEAFRSKRKLSKEYKNRFVKGDIMKVNVDFNNSPGEFICYMCGHIHTYFNYEVNGIPDSNPNLPNQVVLVSNNMSPSEKNPISPIERETVGIKNNTFNIYSIDTKKRTIDVTFFGATLVSYPHVINVKY